MHVFWEGWLHYSNISKMACTFYCWLCFSYSLFFKITVTVWMHCLLCSIQDIHLIFRSGFSNKDAWIKDDSNWWWQRSPVIIWQICIWIQMHIGNKLCVCENRHRTTNQEKTSHHDDCPQWIIRRLIVISCMTSKHCQINNFLHCIIKKQ